MDRVPELLDWLAQFMGTAWVSKQLQRFQQHQSESFAALTIADSHPFVRGLAERLALPGSASPSEPLRVSGAMLRVASYAYDLQWVRQYVPSVLGSPKLLGRLRSSRVNAESLLFELAVGVNYWQLGCDVEFPELGGGSNIDVLVGWDAEEVEIQCKRKVAGSGRKVPSGSFKRLVLSITDAWRAADGEFALVLRCSDRLERRDLPALATEINSRLAAAWQGETPIMDGAYLLAVEKKGAPGSRVAAGRLILDIKPFFSDPAHPPHLAVIGELPIQLVGPSASVSPAYFVCSSLKQDTVLDNIMESFRKGARQLAGTRPVIVAVHVPEPMTQEALERMTLPTALGDALKSEFDDPGRSLSRAAAVVISGENLSPFHEREWWAGFPGVIFRNEDSGLRLPGNYPVLGELPPWRTSSGSQVVGP